MYNIDTELLFPSRIINELSEQRGEEWKQLVERVHDLPSRDLDKLAFVLMMARLDGCNTCNSDSFRAMRGCTQCALQNIRRFRGTDKELLKEFEKARNDIKKFHSSLE